MLPETLSLHPESRKFVSVSAHSALDQFIAVYGFYVTVGKCKIPAILPLFFLKKRGLKCPKRPILNYKTVFSWNTPFYRFFP